MALQNYSHPQSLIRQLLDRIEASAVPRMATVILATRYLLNRFGKEDTISEAFDTDGQTLTFQYKNTTGVTTQLPTDYEVDHGFTRVHGEGLNAVLAEFAADGTNKFFLGSALSPHIFRLANTLVASNGAIDTLLRGRPVQVGDKATVNDGVSGDIKRTVIGLVGKAVDSTFGTDAGKQNEDSANAAYNAVTVASESSTTVVAPVGATITVDDATAFNATVRGSKISGRYGEEFIFTVSTGGAPGTAKVNISSTTGKWSALNVATADSAGDFSITDVASGNELAGCDFTITSGSDLTVGQVFKIQVFNAFTQLDETNMAAAGTYAGTKDTTYVVEIVTGTTGDTLDAAVVNIHDTSGVDDPILGLSITEGTAFNLGTSGLTMKATDPGDWADGPQGGFLAGDKYIVHAVAATNSTTDFDRIVLDGPGVDTSLFTDTATAVGVTFSLDATGEIAVSAAGDGSAWESTDDGVVVDSALSLYVGDRSDGYQWVPFVTAVGSLTASWRAAVPSSGVADGMKAISSNADVVDAAGTVDVDNLGGYAAQVGFEGAQGRRIYFLNVGEDTVDNWALALRKLESTDTVTFIGGVTALPEAARRVRAHCEAQSQPDKKNFRRCYVGVDSPGKYSEVGAQSNGSAHTATIEDNGGVNTMVRFSSDISLSGFTIVAGDELRVVTDPDNPEVYPIASVVSETELLLSAGPLAPISPAVPVEVWRQDSADSQGAFVSNFAQGLGSRRAMPIWQESGTIDIGAESVEISNGFNACHIAGLRSALLPQQGLTRTEVSTITSAPAMYNKYTPDDLDAIAANGVTILAQEHENGPIYIRHQLTSDVSNGSLYYEDSVGVVVDYISLRFKDALAGFIGKKNVTDETLTEIRAVCEDILVQSSEVPYNADYGPTIVDFLDLVVKADPTLPDQILVTVTLRVALPVNYLDVTLHTTV